MNYTNLHSYYEVNMKIGELAKLTQCHPETIRYYQKIGLLFEPDKDQSGYGRYNHDHLAHVRLLRRSKELGFSQTQMRELISLTATPGGSCQRVHELTVRQLASVKEKILHLQEITGALNKLKVACEENTVDECPTLVDMLSFTKS